MANVQVKIDDNLKMQAHAVVTELGLDLSSAVRLFLTQMVREQGLPFQPKIEKQKELSDAMKQSLADRKAGRMVTISLDELEKMAD